MPVEPFQLVDLDEDPGRRHLVRSLGHARLRSTESADHAFPALAFEQRESDGRLPTNREAEITYTASELAKAVEEAKAAVAAEVEASVRAAMAAEISQQQSRALRSISDQLAASEQAYGREMAEAAVIVQNLAVMLAKAIVPKALERQPFADIGDVVRQTLKRLIDQPEIELRLAPNLANSTADILAGLVADTGYRGRLTTVADPSLESGDARLSWKGGVAERRPANLQAEVAALIDIWLRDGMHATVDASSPELAIAPAEQPLPARSSKQDDQPQPSNGLSHE